MLGGFVSPNTESLEMTTGTWKQNKNRKMTDDLKEVTGKVD